MSEEEFPVWLRAMQNGTIGEARTRAFLIDRFWLLERSVDIDGADFIIQRRITSSNLLDEKPPRFGIVQAKFFAGSDTTHYIPKQYVTDKDGEVRTEFFLICHTGAEDDPKSYLLTAEDLVNDFTISSDDKIWVSGRKLLASAKYQILLRARSLDRIEHALLLADFKKNRSFLSWFLPDVTFDLNSIDSLYKEPIENWWGDIPEGFQKLKQAARDAIYDVEDIHRSLVAICQENDPEKALAVAERLNGSFGRWHFPDDLWSQDFYWAVLQHKNKVLTLKEAGLLDPFIRMKEIVLSAIARDLAPHMPIDLDQIHRIEIRYDPITFRDVAVAGKTLPIAEYRKNSNEIRACSGVSAPEPTWYEMLHEGCVIVCWLPGRFCVTGKNEVLEWKSHLKKIASYFVTKILDEIYDMRFEEPPETVEKESGTLKK